MSTDNNTLFTTYLNIFHLSILKRTPFKETGFILSFRSPIQSQGTGALFHPAKRLPVRKRFAERMRKFKFYLFFYYALVMKLTFHISLKGPAKGVGFFLNVLGSRILLL